MAETTVRKTIKYKLCPTQKQEQALDRVLMSCRHLYNAGLEERREAYRLCGVSVSRWQQEAQLKDIRAELPEYAANHSHVLQEVLARGDRAFHAFFRRVKAGETAGYPRFKGRYRWNSLTYKECGNGARLDN